MINDLRHIDETSECLLEKGYVKEAVDCMELALQQRFNLFGSDSHAYKLSSSNTATRLTQIATSSLYDLKSHSRISLLLRAEYLHKSNDSFRVMIWYHLAKLFQLESNIKESLRYLNKGLASQSMITIRTANDRKLCIEIHLCMSSILSMLKKHNMSLRHARIALKLIERIIVTEKETNITSLLCTEVGGDVSNSYSSLNLLDQHWLAILAISYYNIGTQYEHLRDFNASCDAYEYGLKAASLIGDTNDIRRKLEKAYKVLRSRIKL